MCGEESGTGGSANWTRVGQGKELIWGPEERCGVEAEGCGCGESWGHEEQGSGRRVKEARGVGSGPIRVCVLLVCGEVWRRGGVGVW